MGCDIHPAIEVRRKGVWRYYRPPEPCRYYYEVYDQATADRLNNGEHGQKYGQAKVGDRRNTWDRCKTRLPDFFRDRNYTLFAILANVRNDGEIDDPIAPDRGLPEDISKEARAKMSNEHSETWVGLDELMAYDLAAPAHIKGVIDERQYLETFLKHKDPTHWSGGISGKDIVVVTPDQWLAMWPEEGLFGPTTAPKNPRDPSKRYYIHYEWQVPRISQAPQLKQWIDYLTPLIPKGGTAEDVRVVMDFDS